MRILPIAKQRLAFSAVVLLAMAAWGQQNPKTTPPPSGSMASGWIENGMYRNSLFGFSYKLPVSWVDRTEEMQQGLTDSGKSRVLLAIFEHPPEVTAKDVNSAVVIAVESTSSYPGLKAPAQYFGPITEVATEKGFKVFNPPYEFPVDAKPIARADYIKQLPAGTMYQSSLVLLSNGYAVSFTFVGSSDEEVYGLIDGLSFGKVKKPKAALAQ